MTRPGDGLTPVSGGAPPNATGAPPDGFAVAARKPVAPVLAAGGPRSERSPSAVTEWADDAPAGVYHGVDLNEAAGADGVSGGVGGRVAASGWAELAQLVLLGVVAHRVVGGEAAPEDARPGVKRPKK